MRSTLKNLFMPICLCALIIPVFAQDLDSEPVTEPQIESELDIDELRRRIYNEDPAELMSMSLGDNNVSLVLSGFWKGSLQFNFGLINSPLGWGFNSPDTPFLFQQEADITLSLWINNRWFLEAGFQDNSALNTYRAGFQGGDENFLKYAGIGNTGLDFPAFPYLDLGGDSPSSFGFYGRMGTDNLAIHTLLRYDTASREERVFSGSRERTISYVQPDNYIRGVSFVLPDSNIDIDFDIEVYIEDPNGSLSDLDGRRWRLLLSSEYAASRTDGLLELGIRNAGMVAVSYKKDGNEAGYNMGFYSASSGGNPGEFLFEVQEYFNTSGIVINLEEYPQCGDRVDPLTGAAAGKPGYAEINNIRALVIFEAGTFSPFERMNRYDAPSSTSEQADVILMSAGSVQNDFELIPVFENAASGDLPLYSQAVSQRNVYELLPAASSSGYDPNARRLPQSMWPLASKKYAEIYLMPRSVYTGDIVLRFTNFSGAQGYFIGADVVPGSVQVWRSGIQDSNFTYNQSAGQVTLHSPAGVNEIIRITYLKRSEETRLGSIAAGIGVNYRNGESPFSVQGAVGLRWNIIESSAFTEQDNYSAGTIGISGRAAWDYDFFKAHITAGFSYEQTDTTGLYRAAGMEGHRLLLLLLHESSFISNPPQTTETALVLNINNRADLIYKNYFNNNLLGSNLMTIDWPDAQVITGLNKPYPVKDPLLGEGQNLVADFILEPGQWTGFQVPVGNDSDFILRSSEILIPFRIPEYDPSALVNLKLIIQIGTLSSGDVPFSENISLIWEGCIYDGTKTVTPGYIDENGCGIAYFVLTEDQKLKLGDAAHLRIIAVNENPAGSGITITERFILSPPVFHGASFRPITIDNTGVITGIPDNVTAFETMDNGLDSNEIVKRLHSGTSSQRVLKINWEDLPAGMSAGADGRIGAIPLASYREISFFFKAPDTDYSEWGANLKFIIASGHESINTPFLSCEIPLNKFIRGEWAKVTVRYQGSRTGIYINDIKINEITPPYFDIARAAAHQNPVNYAAFLIVPGLGESLKNASVCIDEIILEDPCADYKFNAGSAAEYRREGTLLSIGDFPVFSNLRISSYIESEIRINEDNESSDLTSSVINRTSLELDIFGAKLKGNVSLASLNKSFSWIADHSISREIGKFSFKEEFYASPESRYLQHTLNLAYLSNFYFNFDADAVNEFSRLRQRWNLRIGYRPLNEFIPVFALNSNFLWIKNNLLDENQNYGELWINSWEPLLPDAGKNANTRSSRTQIVITQRTKPVGAVLTFDGITNFSAINNLSRLENSLFLDIPLVFSTFNLNFRAGRRFARHLYYQNIDFFDDAGDFFESISDSMSLWRFIPVYSLFTGGLNSAMDSITSSEFAYTAFNDHISARLNLPRRHDLTAFIIPSRAAFSLERVLEQKMDTRSDILNLSISAGFSAVNMFGSMGYKPIFNFYQTDEINYSIQAAVAFNKNEITWRIQSVAGASLRLSNTGSLSFLNTLTLLNDNRWTESFMFYWTAPAEKTLINVLYSWISGAVSNSSSWPGLSSLLSSDYRQLRRESLELFFDKSLDYLKWNIIAGHEAIIRVQGRLEFSGFVKLRLGQDLLRETFSADILLGTALRVNF